MIRRCIACLLLASGIASAEPHAGFEVAKKGESIIVSDVHECSPTFFSGVFVGDKIIEAGGKIIKTEDDLKAVVAKRAVGKLMPLRVLRGDEKKKVLVHVMDAEDVKSHVAKELHEKAAEEKRARELAEKKAIEEAERAARTREYVEQHGPLLYVGRVTEDVIGQPEIRLLVENLSKTDVEAVRFKVAVFDKFGDKVKDAFSGDHEKEFLYQHTIRPSAETWIRLGIPWHTTAGKATVVATEYVMADGRRVSPPHPKVAEIRNER